MTTKKRVNPRKTAGRLVIDTFKNANAFSEKTAQPVEICKDLPLSSTVIAYTITNMMEDDIFIKTEDNRFYFSQENWAKFEKRFNRIYWILLGIPIALTILFLVIDALL
ncbi:MAG: hypothetical protein CVU94_05350 [Firmicutes bacterium HGW-Firmicutes-19]|nr:MAG: hypothetical protein CVU94_05350 [Firmicutes bacterium HGW-Firmicutes-19]